MQHSGAVTFLYLNKNVKLKYSGVAPIKPLRKLYESQTIQLALNEACDCVLKGWLSKKCVRDLNIRPLAQGVGTWIHHPWFFTLCKQILH